MSPLPSDFKIRRARLEDLSQIAQLEKRVWKDLSASKAEIKRRFLQFPQGIRVALVGNLIVGCCQGALFESIPEPENLSESFPPEHVASGKHLFLFGLAVNPLFRRKGVASALVASELDIARRRRCLLVQTIANSASRIVFERQSFSTVQPLPGLFRDFGALMQEPLLMERALSEPEDPS